MMERIPSNSTEQKLPVGADPSKLEGLQKKLQKVRNVAAAGLAFGLNMGGQAFAQNLPQPGPDFQQAIEQQTGDFKKDSKLLSNIQQIVPEGSGQGTGYNQGEITYTVGHVAGTGKTPEAIVQMPDPKLPKKLVESADPAEAGRKIEIPQDKTEFREGETRMFRDAEGRRDFGIVATPDQLKRVMPAMLSNQNLPPDTDSFIERIKQNREGRMAVPVTIDNPEYNGKNPPVMPVWVSSVKTPYIKLVGGNTFDENARKKIRESLNQEQLSYFAPFLSDAGSSGSGIIFEDGLMGNHNGKVPFYEMTPDGKAVNYSPQNAKLFIQANPQLANDWLRFSKEKLNQEIPLDKAITSGLLRSIPDRDAGGNAIPAPNSYTIGRFTPVTQKGIGDINRLLHPIDELNNPKSEPSATNNTPVPTEQKKESLLIEKPNQNIQTSTSQESQNNPNQVLELIPQVQPVTKQIPDVQIPGF